MAENNQVDELKLGISIGKLNNKQIANLNDLNKSLKELDNVLTSDLMKKLEVLSNIQIKVNLGNLKKANDKLKETAQNAKGVLQSEDVNLGVKIDNDTVNKLRGIVKKYKELEEINSKLADNDINKISNKMEMSQLTQQARDIIKNYKRQELFKADTSITDKIVKDDSEPQEENQIQEEINKKKRIGIKLLLTKIRIQRAISKIKKEELKDSEDTNKKDKKAVSTFSKLRKTIGRVAIYRAIRATLKTIVKTIREGAQAFAQFSPEFNQSMTQLMSAGKNLAMSFTSAFAPIIQTITPYIVNLANTITNINNSIGEAIAYMQGLGEYTKVNTEYQEDYNKAVSKLSFDKFDVLQDSSYGGFEKVAIDTEKMAKNEGIFENIKSVVESFKTMLLSVKEPLGTMWEIIKGFATEYGDEIAYVLKQCIGFIQDVIYQINVVFIWIKNIMNLDFTKGLLYTGLGGLKLILTTIRAITQSITEIMRSLANMDFSGLRDRLANIWSGADWVSGLFTSEKGTNGMLDAIKKFFNTKGKFRIGNFATGGIPDVGTLFYAGEAGAEIVANTGHGTGVMNMEQLRSAVANGMREALYSMRQPNSNETIEIKISDETLFTTVRNSAKRRGLDFANV